MWWWKIFILLKPKTKYYFFGFPGRMIDSREMCPIELQMRKNEFRKTCSKSRKASLLPPTALPGVRGFPCGILTNIFNVHKYNNSRSWAKREGGGVQKIWNRCTRTEWFITKNKEERGGENLMPFLDSLCRIENHTDYTHPPPSFSTLIKLINKYILLPKTTNQKQWEKHAYVSKLRREELSFWKIGEIKNKWKNVLKIYVEKRTRKIYLPNLEEES